VDFPVVLARIRSQVASRRADPLTGLPNRVLFMEQLERVLVRARAAGRDDFAIMFLDVDRFKIINDSLGHLAGDRLLVGIAKRLQTSLRGTDVVARFEGDATVARFGGDEFTILLDGVTALTDAVGVAERVLDVCVRPFDLQGREVFTSLSIGLVMGAARYEHAEDLVRDADTAMYRAKTRGKARVEVFDTSMRLAVEQQLQLESELRHALDRGEMRLHYQPIVTLQGGELAGFEALLRWQHPTRGLIAPAEFLPLAEETGLILSIGRWAIREACRQMRAWDREYGERVAVTMSVNLSARQCRDPDLVRDLAHILEDTGLAATRLKLDIPENVLFEHSEAVLEIMTDVRALGVQLGLDDFGMGYSALTYLRRFPFQTLKIDRTFVHAMQQAGNAEIVRAIVSLAGSLALHVTAEGVETAEQVAGLSILDCELGQGFFFHKPMPSQDIDRMLRHDPSGSGLPQFEDPRVRGG
jgi:diguanylate cyclase (GGDEF)-like protein